jgi:hypothetical protein
MTIDAKVIEHSVSKETGKQIITIEATYPRMIHAEVLTHRVFSRNGSSSRAIPVLRVLKRILTDMAKPVHWGRNQAGMQANHELTGIRLFIVQTLWTVAGYFAVFFSYLMQLAGAHKQIANRVTETYSHITVVITSTEWANWYELRDHPDAQPEIRALALAMKLAVMKSHPVVRSAEDPKNPHNWHLPYISNRERDLHSIHDLLKMSTARCARTSYLTHDKQNPSADQDVNLHDKLVASRPIHASPTEHQAMPARTEISSGNFIGWKQYRKQIEKQFNL